ncbi:hypothetical protein A374_04099 [Fictibacillus macauensis ZFHKF-1]|uniref:Uncharacterized protein n=1 Tax=Fictibacillus macauensis ZFHKF-1 TaxID=1196324 RepID=I8AM31_9BACL|nr:hypothetical protein [Fictibacillus macauensis]EIT86724.1 hypothetical protein A374_04099 [Fictibacillus macauensis ZFHKF-1]
MKPLTIIYMLIMGPLAGIFVVCSYLSYSTARYLAIDFRYKDYLFFSSQPYSRSHLSFFDYVLYAFKTSYYPAVACLCFLLVLLLGYGVYRHLRQPKVSF